MYDEENIVIDTIWPPDFSNSNDPKYIVLIQSMRGAIRSGLLEPGHKLPPVREFAWQLGITPGTVARAYKMAAEEGLVDTAVGRGTFVTGGLNADHPIHPDPLILPARASGLDFRAVRVQDTGQDARILQLMSRLCDDPGLDLTEYPSYDTDAPAREQVVHWIGPDRAGRFGADEVVLSLGAQNGLLMALQTILHGPSPVILTEELAYQGCRHAARLLRAQIIGVEMDEQGVRPDKLEEALRRHGGQVLITSAEVHSPTTIRTTIERRQQIARIAQKYQLQIIDDDCHTITRHDRPSYRAICPERAWYISALTKSVSAALRFGFIVAPHRAGDLCAPGHAIELLRPATTCLGPEHRAVAFGRGRGDPGRHRKLGNGPGGKRR